MVPEECKTAMLVISILVSIPLNAFSNIFQHLLVPTDLEDIDFLLEMEEERSLDFRVT